MEDTSIEKNQTLAAISFLRFPLIVMVVALHVILNPEANLNAFPCANEIILLCRKVSNAAVPAFFLFAGYLFFRSGTLNATTYAKKIRSRIRSLVLPFIIWNILWILCAFVAWKIDLPATRNPWEIFSAKDWLPGFFGYRPSGLPLIQATWFLRDLFLASLLAPLFYIVAKYLGAIALLAVGGIWVCGWQIGVPGFEIRCIFFFLAGTFFALKQIDFAAEFRRLCVPAIIAWIALVTWTTLTAGTFATPRFANLEVLVSIIAIIGIGTKISETQENSKFKNLSNATFFVFCSHMFFTAGIAQLFPFFNFDASWKILCAYFGTIIIATSLSIVSYLLLGRAFPRTLKILNGGRVTDSQA